MQLSLARRFFSHSSLLLLKDSRHTTHKITPDNLVFLRPVENIGTVHDILKSTQHNVFPDMEIEEEDIRVGTMNRSALYVMLKHRSFGSPKGKPNSSHSQLLGTRRHEVLASCGIENGMSSKELSEAS